MSDIPATEQSIEDIIGSVAAGEKASTGPLPPDTLQALADRVDLIVADIGRWESYKAASAEYIAAFKTEVEWHARIRLAVAIAGGVVVVFLGACLVLGVLWAGPLFSKDNAHALTALIAATITGIVVVTIAVAKGAFSTMADRNAGLPMPEHIKELIEAGKSMMGGGQ